MSLRLLMCFAMYSCLALGHSPPALADGEGAMAACELSCDQAMADCDRKLGAKGRCMRKKLECSERCGRSAGKAAPVDPSSRKTLCTQRCDLNRNICDEANGSNTQACADGQKTCTERCG